MIGTPDQLTDRPDPGRSAPRGTRPAGTRGMSLPVSRIRHFVSETSRIPVVGVQPRQDAIWSIVGPPDSREDRASWHGDALLEPEPENRHDPGAVRVSI